MSTVASGSGGWESWRWDDTLFKGAAPYYRRGRFPYAAGLAQAMAESLGLDGRRRLLDLGCGPGVIALQLAHLFEEVVGLDPDGEMLDEAARLAADRGITHARWVRLRAEDLRADLGSFRVVTLAASFHWMDRPKVAASIRTMLESGGAAVQIDAPGRRPDAPKDDSDLPHPTVPTEAITRLRTRYLGPDTRAGQGIRNSSPSGEDTVFQAAGFLPAQRIVVPDGRVLERTIDEEVAMLFSSSSTAPHLFGDRVASFEADLRDLLMRSTPSGLYSVRLPDNTIDIWRLPQ